MAISSGVSMGRRIFYFSLLSLSLAACSNVETRKQALGDFDYLNIEPTKPITVPENLNAPTERELYKVPDVENDDGPLGKRVDVRAPALVLPLASGSRIDEFDKSAAIWFDKVDDDRDLREQVIQAIRNYLKDENVELLVDDPANNTWQSDWFHIEEESGYLFWKSVDLSESWQFKFTLVTKPHGRSVGLNVELVKYMYTDEQRATKKIDPIEEQRVEVAMVNSITSQLDYQYRLNSKEDRIARANMQIVTLVENEQGDTVLNIDYPIDELWSYLPGFFDKYNFKVTDLNEDKYIYHTEFTYVEASLWETIWGDDAPVIDIESGVYRFKLVEVGKQTQLIISDDQKTPLSKELLEKNFEILDPALSFR